MKSYGVFNDEKKVAKPAAFIVDKKGILRWRYVGKDNYDRPNPAALIEKIGNIKQP